MSQAMGSKPSLGAKPKLGGNSLAKPSIGGNRASQASNYSKPANEPSNAGGSRYESVNASIEQAPSQKAADPSPAKKEDPPAPSKPISFLERARLAKKQNDTSGADHAANLSMEKEKELNSIAQQNEEARRSSVERPNNEYASGGYNPSVRQSTVGNNLAVNAPALANQAASLHQSIQSSVNGGGY